MSLYPYIPVDDIFRNYFIDDFIGNSLAGRTWTTAGSGSWAFQSDGLGGVLIITANGSTFYRFYQSSTPTVLSLAGNLGVLWRMKLSSLSDIRGSCGTNSSDTNMLEIYYNSSVGSNWLCRTLASSVETVVDTGLVADTNYHEFFIGASSDVANFFIDGIPKAAITTNLPSVAMSPMVQVNSLTATTKSLYADLVECYGDRLGLE